MNSIDIFTDGSALSNSKNSSAGWAVYFPIFDILRSGHMIGTNNAAELRAIDYGLWYTYVKLNVKKGMTINIKTDSQYSIDVITGVKKSYANLEVLSRISSHIMELKKIDITINFIHVDAHTKRTDKDSIYNDIVDKEARRQASK